MTVNNNPSGGRGRSGTAPPRIGPQGQGERRRSGTWPPGGQRQSNSWGRVQDEPEDSGVWGAPRGDTFGDSGDEWPREDVMGGGGRGRNRQDFGSDSFYSDGSEPSTFGDSSSSQSFDSGSSGSDTFGDTGSDTFGEGGGFDGGFGGGFDQYGFGDFTDTSKCGCFEKKEDLVDMDQLALHLYDLLRREVYVERERMGHGLGYR